MLTGVDVGNCFHNSISLYLFCGIDFVFSGLSFSGTAAKGKPEKLRCHFIFVIELPVSPFLIEFGHMANQHKIPNMNEP